MLTIDTRFDASSNGTNNHPYLHRAITSEKAQDYNLLMIYLFSMVQKVYIKDQIGNAVPPLLARRQPTDQIEQFYSVERYL